MFNIIKISPDNSKFLQRIQKIYETSFPENERRDFNNVIYLINNKYFNFNAITFDELIVGIFFYWTFSEFIYIEHFAIDKNYRNDGIGSFILNKFINEQEKQIVLEVEIPIDEISLKRIRFYEKYGFFICKENYIQPPYSPDKESVPMLIMSRPEITTLNEFDEIKNKLYRHVYNSI